jgi:hypothetical protein
MTTQNPMSVPQILQRTADRYTCYLASKKLAEHIKQKYPQLQEDPEVADLIGIIESPRRAK